MFPWWNKTVTHFIKSEAHDGQVIWTKEVLKGCYWHYDTDDNRGSGESARQNEYSCYIPMPCSVNVGDLLFNGETEEVIYEYSKGIRSSDFMNKHKDNVILVTKVIRNDSIGGCLKHVCCKGA